MVKLGALSQWLGPGSRSAIGARSLTCHGLMHYLPIPGLFRGILIYDPGKQKTGSCI